MIIIICKIYIFSIKKNKNKNKKKEAKIFVDFSKRVSYLFKFISFSNLKYKKKEGVN